MLNSEPRRTVTQVPEMARTPQWMAVTIRAQRCHGNNLLKCRGTFIHCNTQNNWQFNLFFAPQSDSTKLGNNGSCRLLSTTLLINQGWWKVCFSWFQIGEKNYFKGLQRCFAQLGLYFVCFLEERRCVFLVNNLFFSTGVGFQKKEGSCK